MFTNTCSTRLEETKIAVTGSSGLIGRYLCSALRSSGVSVREIDLKTPNDPVDIRDFSAVQERLVACDGIIHLAAVSRVVWAQKNPSLCVSVNEQGTTQLLDAAISANKAKPPWVLFGSSREVYGQASHLPVTEADELLPMNVYARSKVYGENAMREYQCRGAPTSIVRFSSVYGCIHDHSDRVFPAFVRNAWEGKILRVDGKDNLLDFTHISDVVNGLLNVISQLMEGQSVVPLHLTSGKPISLGQLAELAIEHANTTAEVQFASPRSYDVSRFYGDPATARNVIKWAPVIDVQQGIDLFLSALDRAEGRV